METIDNIFFTHHPGLPELDPTRRNYTMNTLRICCKIMRLNDNGKKKGKRSWSGG
jgi:hypothetical protein